MKPLLATALGAVLLLVVAACSSDTADNADETPASQTEASGVFESWAPSESELPTSVRSLLDLDTGNAIAYSLYNDTDLAVYVIRQDDQVRLVNVQGDPTEPSSLAAVGTGSSLTEFVRNGAWIRHEAVAPDSSIAVFVPPLHYANEGWTLQTDPSSDAQVARTNRSAVIVAENPSQLPAQTTVVCSCGDVITYPSQ